MIRLSALFVAICMLLIAGSFSAVLYLTFGLSGAEALICGLAALTGIATYNTVATRKRYQAALGGQIADLARGVADLARQVAEQGRRLATLERSTDSVINKALALTQPVQAEIGELGVLVKQMAETVAGQDLAIQRLAAGRLEGSVARTAPLPAAGAPSQATADVDVDVGDVGDEAASSVPATAVNGHAADDPFKGLSQHEIVAAIRDAIEADRIDTYLQPIVSLPQRKVCYYEALARMRSSDGQVIPASDFIPHAEDGELVAKIDHLMLIRGVRVLRRLLAKNRETGIFLNVSPSTLRDPVFVQMAEFIEANRALAGSLMLEFPYAPFRTLGARENSALSTFSKLGFKFSVDHVSSLRIDAHELADRTCGFIKVPAPVLLDRTIQATSDIHPQDLAGLLARFGVTLIAEKIESEETVVDLIDFEVKFGQGTLFSPARPIRPEATTTESVGALADAPVPAPEAVPAASAAVAEAAPPAEAERVSALARLARAVGRG